MRKFPLILNACFIFAQVVLAQNATTIKLSTSAFGRSGGKAEADPEAERRLFNMANADRVKAGLPPLQMDDGLTQEAREHAVALAATRQLSHQLAGEMPLNLRLASHTKLHFDREGENVASAPTVEQAHESLMLSPSQRENVLNAAYNVAGFGVARSGNTLFVTEDFAKTESLSPGRQ
ncbi:MAG TPA: CAP domain-containing protein [Terriglobales bacterium]|nr:CAP domain-containing protein [Terriglobales bacterium]